jgi:CysZ protein
VIASAVPTPRPPGFFDGVQSFFGGLRLLVTTPKLWAVSLVPMVLFLGAWLVFGSLTVAYLPDAVGGLIGPSDSTLGALGAGLLKFVITAIAIAVAALVALLVAQPLSGPAFACLVRHHEALLGIPARPDTPFFRDMLQSLQSLLVGLAIGLPLMLLLALVGLFFPPSVVVVAPLEFLVATLVVAWDMCDLPLSIRGLPIKTRIAWLASHKLAVFGFGLSCGLVQLIPVLNFIVLPAALLGSTRLVWRIEEHQLNAGKSTVAGRGMNEP